MNDKNLLCHMSKYIGETVTIFTTSGGASGCGFTGMLLSVNPCFVRIMTEQGAPPANPLSQHICPDMYEASLTTKHKKHTLGSVCDIPVCTIASFCHNAV